MFLSNLHSWSDNVMILHVFHPQQGRVESKSPKFDTTRFILLRGVTKDKLLLIPIRNLVR